MASFSEKNDTGATRFSTVNVHKCDEKDFEAFHETVSYQKNQLEELKNSSSLNCLDKFDQFGNPINMTIYG